MKEKIMTILYKTDKIYCDMDGVLADFDNEPNAVDRFRTEKGFFFKLKPLEKNLQGIKFLMKNYDTYILSASPNKQADKDKIKWLKKYLPNLKKEKIIIIRNGEVKAKYATDIEKALLLDDYGVNIREWRQYNGMALKIGDEVPNILSIIE